MFSEDSDETVQPMFSPETGIRERIEHIVTNVYGGDGVDFSSAAERQLKQLEDAGQDKVPVCSGQNPVLIQR